MGIGFWGLTLGLQIAQSRYHLQTLFNLKQPVAAFKYQDSSLPLGVSAVQGLKFLKLFRVQGSGVWGLGFRGLGFRSSGV